MISKIIQKCKDWLAKRGYKLKVVLLDAGHGGLIDGCYQTAGKRSPQWEDGSQYFEGVGNREIRHELIKMLKQGGYRYKVINEGNKDMALRERVNIANAYARKYGRKNVLFISIHSNGFKKESAHGWSCYTSPNQTASDEYATALYEEVLPILPNARLRKDTIGDGDPDKEARFTVLTDTICPAILSENFFHTNEKECKEILMTRQGKRKIAQIHFNMIEKMSK